MFAWPGHVEEEVCTRPAAAHVMWTGKRPVLELVLEFYKDDCRNKPQPTVKKFFESDPNKWTFDYKPESLMRAESS